MEQILKAKHWQIFILVFGLPLIVKTISVIISSITGNHLMIMTKISSIIMLLCLGGLFSWYWAVAIHFQKKLPDELRLKVGLFKLCVFIPIIYFVFGFGLFGEISIQTDAIMGLIMFLHLFSIFSLIYCMQFAAKTFKTIELQRKVSFSDYSGEFFLFWFFPIGIWIIQPKINKMIKN